MFKRCFYCRKLVRTLGSSFKPPRSVPFCKNKIRVGDIRFNGSPAITNRRRFSNDKLPTRVICKACKPKDKKQKPIEYLTSALSGTIGKDYDVEKDDDFSPDNFANDFGSLDNIDDEELSADTKQDLVKFDDENPYQYMTEEETHFWGGAAHTLDNIAVKQGILREMFDKAEDIAHQPDLFQNLFENIPEQLADRQQLLRGRDENMPERQRMLRDAAQNVVEPQARRLPEQHAEQQPGGEVDYIPAPFLIHQLPKYLSLIRRPVRAVNPPQPVAANVPEPIAVQQGLRQDNIFKQLALRQGLVQEAADNVSKQLERKAQNDNLPASFKVRQKILPEDENSVLDPHDNPPVLRLLLQDENDNTQDVDYDPKEPVLRNEGACNDPDVLNLVPVCQELRLDDAIHPKLIALDQQLSSECDKKTA